VNFCFNPLVGQDTIVSFLVAAENQYCSTIDTAYVVYFDNGDNGWSPEDSIDVRSFIPPGGGDTTGTDTTIFVSEIESHSFNVFPNPTRGDITIEHTFEGQATVRIMSASGAILKQEELSNQRYRTNIADLPKGVYLIVLTDERERIVKRIVKL
jgi:hypothetical protein